MTLSKTLPKNWISSPAGAFVAGALILACAAAARPDGGPPAGDGRVVLGTFDSRAIAVAWGGSETFKSAMNDLVQQLADAQEAGDEERVAELEAHGPELQAKLHRQGFSTASVDDILEHIRDEIPAIATQAGVDVIVSKWDIVYHGPSASVIDVTDQLVAALEPDERALKSAREIVQQEPVPLEELRHDH